MAKDTDCVNFVTDDNTGGYFVCECQNCGEVFNSKDCDGGGANADAGDYGDCYCPHCNQVDPEECDNPNLVWNVQQAKINRLVASLEKIASLTLGASALCYQDEAREAIAAVTGKR